MNIERPHEPRFRRLLSEHGRSLERIAASYARFSADREDLLQDFASAIWTALPRFREECSERTFVLRIAQNRALTFLTKRGPVTADLDDHPDAVVASTEILMALVVPWSTWVLVSRWDLYRAEPWRAFVGFGVALAIFAGVLIAARRHRVRLERERERFEELVAGRTLS